MSIDIWILNQENDCEFLLKKVSQIYHSRSANTLDYNTVDFILNFKFYYYTALLIAWVFSIMIFYLMFT